MEKLIQALITAIQALLGSLATTTTKKAKRPPTAPVSLSLSNVELIKESEGLRLNAYLPTPNDVYTIGYGHTKTAEKGMVITLAGAEALLLHDLQWVETAIDTYVQVPLNQNQYDALASFIYNIGGTAFRKSTLLKKLNQKDYNGAANELLRWDKQKGKVLRGLTKRRQLEKDLFLS